MSQQETQVITVVSDYWLVGTMPLTGARIQDVFVDGNTDFVRLHNVQVCRRASGESRAVTLSHVAVAKEKVELVINPESRHEAPVKRYNTFTKKKTSRVFLVAGRYIVQGELHLPNLSHDSVYTLTSEVGRFFPVTQASVSDSNGHHLTAPVVLVNRDFVSCFCVGAASGSQRDSFDSLPSAAEDGELTVEGLLRQLEEVQREAKEGIQSARVAKQENASEEVKETAR